MITLLTDEARNRCISDRLVSWDDLEVALLYRLRRRGYLPDDFALLLQMNKDRWRSGKFYSYVRWYPYLDPR